MAFERSTEGQRNRARFLGVQIICYVEGGGGKSNDSDDGIFWSQVFKSARPDLKIKFLAKGGKPVLEALARTILDENIKNTIVAMDADYGRLEERIIDDPRVFYTNGYSWENDILNQDYVIGIVAHVCSQVNGLSAENEEFIRVMHDDICSKLKWAVKADYAMLVAGSSLFPRDKPGQVISSEGPEVPPKVQQKFLVSHLKQKRRSLQGARISPKGVISKVGLECVGHIYFFACMQVIKSSIRRIKKSIKITADHIRDTGLIFLSNDIRSNTPSSTGKYYVDVCSRF